MNKPRGPANLNQRVGLLAEIIRNARLIWRLLWDARVSPWLKLLIPAAFLYLIFPIDIVPDFVLGPGELDDLGVILLAVWLFLELAPREIVQEHVAGTEPVDVSWRVMDEEGAQGAKTDAGDEVPLLDAGGQTDEPPPEHRQ